MPGLNNIYNSKFTKAILIYSRLTSKTKGKQIDKNDIIEWCAQCEVEEIRDSSEWFLYKDLVLDIHKHNALVPCNLYRLLDVMDMYWNRIPYYNDGTYIRMDSKFYGKQIRINYYGLPIDPDGRPLIVKGHEKACEYFCMKQIMEEDFLTGKLNNVQWQYILSEYDDGLQKAWHSIQNLSRNEMEEISRIKHNMTAKPGLFPVYNMD